MDGSGEQSHNLTSDAPVVTGPPRLAGDRTNHLATTQHVSHGKTQLVFTGEYRHSVDEKGRIAVPSRFRSQLEGGAFVSRWIDSCLAIFPRQGWEALADRVGGLPVADAGSRAFQRFLFSGAVEAELDRQGRIVVPAFLREWAGLEGEAVIVGSRDHAEIWAPARWTAVRAELEDPAALAGHLTGLGI